MKTIGTLEEIGAQVGDVVECFSWIGEFYRAGSQYPVVDENGEIGKSIEIDDPCGKWRIVTRAEKSPVRTVTRKEIVPGVYGRVTAERLDNADWCFEVKSMRTASDLTAAIKTLTEIRDAMQYNA